jgi:GYF domain 2
MQKIWYIEIDGKREGPYSVAELKRDHRLTPEILVWKKGFKKWVPIRNVPELKEVFADDHTHDKEKDKEESQKRGRLASRDELAIDMRFYPPYFFWILLTVVIITYIICQMYWLR